MGVPCTIIASIPKRYQRFIKAINNVRDESWGTIFVESLKYNPKYSHLFTTSDDMYKNKFYAKSLAFADKEKQDVKVTRELLCTKKKSSP